MKKGSQNIEIKLFCWRRKKRRKKEKQQDKYFK